ncbi:hypothetical protein CspeluHIS016_0300480 [Cutaneotrichosporon spelunceum]|uniref:Uncharacterized protein n=1 Tax=Cutaneotrichosporon spelunceum TaxID=1672016 RepID=A0AAD3TT70_9TREE|nr:hypothetical protein CspeluHIS016_0300480 [Cutaneotrichosporon spelunceum]
MTTRPLYVNLPFVPDGPEMIDRPPDAGTSSQGGQIDPDSDIPAIPYTTGQYHTLEDARKAVNSLTRTLGFEVNFSSVKDGKYCNLVCHRHGANGAYGARGTKRPRGTKATGCPFKVNCKLRHGMWHAKLSNNTHNHGPQDASELPQLRRERLEQLKDEIHERLIVQGDPPADVRRWLRGQGIALSDSAFGKAVADARKAALDMPEAVGEPMVAFTPSLPGGNLHTLHIPAAVARALAEEYGSEIAVTDDRRFKPYNKPRGAQKCGYCKKPGHRINQCDEYEQRHGHPYHAPVKPKRAASSSSPVPEAHTSGSESAVSTNANPPAGPVASAPSAPVTAAQAPAHALPAGQEAGFHPGLGADVILLEQAFLEMPPAQAQAYLSMQQGQPLSSDFGR